MAKDKVSKTACESEDPTVTEEVQLNVPKDEQTATAALPEEIDEIKLLTSTLAEIKIQESPPEELTETVKLVQLEDELKNTVTLQSVDEDSSENDADKEESLPGVPNKKPTEDVEEGSFASNEEREHKEAGLQARGPDGIPTMHFQHQQQQFNHFAGIGQTQGKRTFNDDFHSYPTSNVPTPINTPAMKFRRPYGAGPTENEDYSSVPIDVNVIAGGNEHEPKPYFLSNMNKGFPHQQPARSQLGSTAESMTSSPFSSPPSNESYYQGNSPVSYPSPPYSASSPEAPGSNGSQLMTQVPSPYCIADSPAESFYSGCTNVKEDDEQLWYDINVLIDSELSAPSPGSASDGSVQAPSPNYPSCEQPLPEENSMQIRKPEVNACGPMFDNGGLNGKPDFSRGPLGLPRQIKTEKEHAINNGYYMSQGYNQTNFSNGPVPKQAGPYPCDANSGLNSSNGLQWAPQPVSMTSVPQNIHTTVPSGVQHCMLPGQTNNMAPLYTASPVHHVPSRQALPHALPQHPYPAMNGSLCGPVSSMAGKLVQQPFVNPVVPDPHLMQQSQPLIPGPGPISQLATAGPLPLQASQFGPPCQRGSPPVNAQPPTTSAPIIVVVVPTSKSEPQSQIKQRTRREPVPILPKPPAPTSNGEAVKKTGIVKEEPVSKPAQTNGAPVKEGKLLVARRYVSGLSDESIKAPDPSDSRNTLLHKAVLKKEAHLVKSVLERSLRSERLHGLVNTPNQWQQTPLLLAVKQNHKVAVELLLQNHADPNIPGKLPTQGCGYRVKSPLHLAAEHGDHRLAVLKSLLNVKGLNLYIQDDEGKTPLQCAIMRHGSYDIDQKQKINSVPVIAALRVKGARCDMKDPNNGKTALHYAIETGHLDVIMELSSQPGDYNIPDFNGNTCLHLAAGASNMTTEVKVKVVKQLIRRGANLELVNYQRLTARDLVPSCDIEVRAMLTGSFRMEKHPMFMAPGPLPAAV